MTQRASPQMLRNCIFVLFNAMWSVAHLYTGCHLSNAVSKTKFEYKAFYEVFVLAGTSELVQKSSER